MSRWPMVALGDSNFIEKGTSPTLKTQPGKFPLVVTAEFRRSADSWQIEGPAVCVPLISSTGHGDASLHRVHYQEGRFALANLLVALTPKDPSRLSAKYLYWLLMARKDQLLVPLMAGSANVSLKEADIARVQVPLPQFAEQQAIVTRLDELAEKSERLTAHWQASADDAATLLSVRFAELIADAPRRPLSAVAPLLRRPIEIDDEQSYTELGIKSFYKGAFRRRTVSGSEFTWQKMFAVNEGDLMFSNIMAWEQAIAVAGPEHAGCITNHRMLICDVDRTIADPSFLWFYFTTAQGFTGITAASPGTAARNKTLNPEALQAISVPLPARQQQLAFVELHKRVTALQTEQAAQRNRLEQLRKAFLDQAFS